MSLFPETIKVKLGGGIVEAAFLVLFDFASSPMRVWNGPGVLDTNDGNAWSGLGEIGSVTGVEQAVAGTAPEMTFTVSGIDPEIARIAMQDFASEARHRMARVYVQFFGTEDPEDVDNQRCLDNPYVIRTGRMMKPSVVFNRGEDDEPETAAVTVTAESRFTKRSRPRHSTYTDADQQARFPGDLGFQFVPSLLNKTVPWPE